MANIEPLITKLTSIAELSKAHHALLAKLPISPRRLARDDVLVHQGEHPTHSAVLLNGVLARSIELPDGTRQTVSYHFNGEMPDLHSLYLKRMDHTVCAVTESVVGLIKHDDLNRMFRESTSLAAIFWRETLIDAAIFRQWITNNGQRGALAGTAHLLCEFITRLRAIGGLDPDGTWLFPFTQSELSDALGVSIVHMNRTLRTLRQRNAATVRKGRLVVLNWQELKSIAGFDGLYLNLRDESLFAG